MSQSLFRHLLATISYRASLAINDVPAEYPSFSLGKEVRSPLQILNHMTNVMIWAQTFYLETTFVRKEIGNWEEEVEHFYQTLEEFDYLLSAGKTPTLATEEQILQGPLADVLTHIGQLNTLRRMVDAPVAGKNYMKVEIQTGKIRP